MTSPTEPDQSATDRAGRGGSTWLPVIAVAVTLLFWASAFIGIRTLAPDFSPGALTLGRLLVGSVCLAVAVIPVGLPRPSRQDLKTLLVIGVLWFGVYNLTLNAGERRIDAGTAAMLIQISPILIAFLAAVFLSERFTVFLGVGLAMAFAGVTLIAISHASGGGSDVIGVLLCVASAVSYAVSVILQKPVMARMNPVHVVWLACSTGAVVCLPFLGQLVRQVAAAPTSSVLWLVYLGIFPTAVAFTTYAYALQHMDASRLGITTYLVPPITIGLGVLVLNESPPAVAYLGGVLALAGVAVARHRPRNQAPAPATDVTPPA